MAGATGEASFGAIQLGCFSGGKLRYVGKVGSGFDERSLKSIGTELRKIPAGSRVVSRKPPDDAQTVWLEPSLVCEVRYASLTSARTLREPVFVRLRPDLDPRDCQLEQ